VESFPKFATVLPVSVPVIHEQGNPAGIATDARPVVPTPHAPPVDVAVIADVAPNTRCDQHSSRHPEL